MAARPLAAVRRYLGRWGLIAALAALPVYYGISDLVNGYPAGFGVCGWWGGWWCWVLWGVCGG